MLRSLRTAPAEALDAWAGRAAGPLAYVAAGLIAAALLVGLAVARPHPHGGDASRIVFLHHAAVLVSTAAYVAIGALSLSTLVDRGRAAAVLAAGLAPTGVLFTFLALWTEALWRRPLLGTWWSWGAEGTAQLLLLFLYAGFMGLRAMIDDPRRAERGGALLALLGAANLPVIYFSLGWWESLQRTALAASMPAMTPAMLAATVLAAAGFCAYAACASLKRARCLVAERHALARALRFQGDPS